MIFLKVEFFLVFVFRTEYFFPEADNETSWENSTMGGNVTGSLMGNSTGSMGWNSTGSGEPYLIVIGTALRTNKHYYKVLIRVFVGTVAVLQLE